MIFTGARDLCLIVKINFMKSAIKTLWLIIFLLYSFTSCKNTTKSGSPITANALPSDSSSLIVVARNFITDVIVKPDTTGDPWEAEKVKGYNGRQFFTRLFEDIYNNKLTAFDCLTGKPMSPGEVKKIEKEFGNDRSKIGKIQFTEDWFWDTQTSKFRKVIKSISFGYETAPETGLPVRYNPLFQIK